MYFNDVPACFISIQCFATSEKVIVTSLESVLHDLQTREHFVIILLYFNKLRANVFLSSAYVVSTGPICRNSVFCLFFFHSVSNFLGFVLVKALPIGTRCPTVQLYTRQEREWERE